MTQLLQAFIVTHRDLIIARTQERVASRSPHAAPALAQGVSTFVDQLTTSLGPDTADRSPRMTGSSESRQTIGASAALHGLELLKEGFTVSQVVHAYGDICQVVTGLAAELDSSISAEDFHVFNRCLDDAIAGAVTAFGGHREAAISDAGTVRIGSLAHEMRNLLNTAQLSFTVLKEGHVGFSGSTAAVHARSLAGLSTLLTRVLADVRVEAGAARLQAHSLLEIVQDLEVAASASPPRGRGEQIAVRRSRRPSTTECA